MPTSLKMIGDWDWRRKAELVRRAKKGDNIFMELEESNISWDEFRSWWRVFHLEGPIGLKMRKSKK